MEDDDSDWKPVRLPEPLPDVERLADVELILIFLILASIGIILVGFYVAWHQSTNNDELLHPKEGEDEEGIEITDDCSTGTEDKIMRSNSTKYY